MTENSRLMVLIGTMVITAVSYPIAMVVYDWIASTGISTNLLTVDQLKWLIVGLAFFIIALICNIGSTKLINQGENVGMLSVFFPLIWAMCTLGMIIGGMIYALIKSQVVVINADIFLNGFFYGLVYALIPALATSLGISTKSGSKSSTKK